MSTSETQLRVFCPECTRRGTVSWTQARAHDPRELQDLSAGFLSIDAGTREGPRIVCQKCRIRADEHPIA